jgi:glycosyltransferase involved in cell wall biosynthesis
MPESPLLATAIAAFLGSSLEVIGAYNKLRYFKITCYLSAAAFTTFSAVVILWLYPGIPGMLVVFVAAYRIFNTLRVMSGRVHERRKHIVTKRTSYYLIFYQIISFLVLAVSHYLGLIDLDWLYLITIAGLLAAAVSLLSVRRSLKRTNPTLPDQTTRPTALPSVSVCIPARDETKDLSDCLQSLLTSDYPKLEILVLDDCSQQRTSEIIKGFAQKGVRFVNGEPVKTSWLAKNQAYDNLTQAASGELLVFCGVDVRFEPNTITALVATMHSRGKGMISLLPRGLVHNTKDGLITLMRYWWELALPRRFFNRPPSLSNCWIITKRALLAQGGFKAVNNMVVPEYYFARELARQDQYSFIRTNNYLDLSSHKTFTDQWLSAIRVRYPQLRKRPESVALLALIQLNTLIVPIVIFLVGFIVPLGNLWLLAGLTVCLYVAVYYHLAKAWRVKNTATMAAGFVAAVLLEFWLIHYSMYRYEFSSVNWKGRNICIPVMQTYRHLPKL